MTAKRRKKKTQEEKRADNFFGRAKQVDGRKNRERGMGKEKGSSSGVRRSISPNINRAECQSVARQNKRKSDAA